MRLWLRPLGAPALGGLARLTAPGWGVAVPAQPADFQAEADSDTRIQLSWLLPPQERIVKYELVYWAAEDEGQQVRTRRCGGRGAAPGPWGSVLGSPRQALPDSGVMGTQPLRLWDPCWPLWFCSLRHPCAGGRAPKSVLGLLGSVARVAPAEPASSPGCCVRVPMPVWSVRCS